MMAFRFGVLGWSPMQALYFNSCKNVIDSLSKPLIVRERLRGRYSMPSISFNVIPPCFQSSSGSIEQVDKLTLSLGIFLTCLRFGSVSDTSLHSFIPRSFAQVLPCLKKFGSKRTFEIGSASLSITYLIWSQSWRASPYAPGTCSGHINIYAAPSFKLPPVLGIYDRTI